jgi:pyruvate ferredoxin oxidoreductase alpha subunit
VAVDELREKGHKVGLIKLRFMRPFPHDELRQALQDVRAVGVFDRSIAMNGYGPVFTETRNSLYRMGMPVTDHIAGIGGRDLTVPMFKQMFERIEESAKKFERDCYWHGLRGEM